MTQQYVRQCLVSGISLPTLCWAMLQTTASNNHISFICSHLFHNNNHSILFQCIFLLTVDEQHP